MALNRAAQIFGPDFPRLVDVNVGEVGLLKPMAERRKDIVLDPFGGSGSTLIAAEKTGRCARLIEFDPLYCDTIVRRYMQVTGRAAVLEGSNLDVEQVAAERAEPAEVVQ